MTWNYRVTRRRFGGDARVWEIREVYYDKKGRVKAWSKDAQFPFGETYLDLSFDLDHMREAFTRPVLDLDGLEKKLAKKRSQRAEK